MGNTNKERKHQEHDQHIIVDSVFQLQVSTDKSLRRNVTEWFIALRFVVSMWRRHNKLPESKREELDIKMKKPANKYLKKDRDRAGRTETIDQTREKREEQDQTSTG